MYEQLAAEVLYHTTLTIVFYESVVLLGSTLGERLEPVGVVCGTHLLSPLFHASSHSVGYATVQAGSIVDDIDEFRIYVGRQVFIHLLTVEHILAEIF